MGFLIPTARPDPGLLTRLGRLLHWTALGLAALVLVVPAIDAAMQPMPPAFHAAPAAQSALRKNGPPDGWEMFDGPEPAVQDATGSTLANLPSPQQGLPYGFWLIAATAIGLVGRAARYLFAGE